MEFIIESTTIGKIAAALSEAQKHIKPAKKNCKNPFHKSDYSDLAAIQEACIPHLSEQGISVTGRIVCESGVWIYVGALLHKESGEFLRTYIPLVLGKNDMQSFGSAQTYAERYALKSLAGVATEDDDGQGAMPKENQQPQMESKISDAQLKYLLSLITTEEQDKIITHYKIEDLSKLTSSQAKTCIDRAKGSVNGK